jgi:hypothetical protein
MPIEILAAKVDWGCGHDGWPELQVLVSGLPSHHELVYTRHPNHSFYYAEVGGYVSFFAAGEGPNGEGYGGRRFTLKLKEHPPAYVVDYMATNRRDPATHYNPETRTVTLIGLWSGSTHDVHELGFGPCFSCDITDDAMVKLVKVNGYDHGRERGVYSWHVAHLRFPHDEVTQKQPMDWYNELKMGRRER